MAAQMYFQTDSFAGLTAPRVAAPLPPPKPRTDEPPKHPNTNEQWPGFIAATRKEWAGILGQKTVTIIPPKEADLIRRQKPDRIVPT